MEKQHDFIMTLLANDPKTSIGDLQDAGYTPDNTQFADKSVYLNSEKIQNNPAFQNDNGQFDQQKFSIFYDNAKTVYNYLANESYVDDLIKQTSYDEHNIFASWDQVDHSGPDFQLVKAWNPDRQTFGMIRVGQQGPRVRSMEEIAQTQQVLDWETKALKESPNEGGFLSDFWTTRVLAQWDYDADENGDPTTDPDKIVYQKGTPKYNENGTYYYETLGGRSIYGKRVLNRANVLTTDGSALNRFDFFDTDDIEQKSFIGSVMRQVALVGPMFIPYVGVVWAGASVLMQLAKLSAIAGKMISGNDSPVLNSIEGWVESMDRQGGRTEAAQQDMWCMENMIGLIGDVAAQLKEQRWLFKYAPVLFGRTRGLSIEKQEAFKDVIRKQQTEQLLGGKTFAQLAKEGKAAWLEESSQIAELRAAEALRKYMETSNKIGSVLSKGYMTGITVADAYGEALEAGADRDEAALLTIGYALAEAALLNTDVGEWIMPELKSNKLRERFLMEAMAGLEHGGSFPKVALKRLDGESRREAAKRIIQAGWAAGEKNASYLLSRKGAGKYIASSLSSGMGEAVEEATEELLADFSKQCFNWIKGENTFEDPWADWQQRYLMSAVGGAIGGSLTALGTDFSKESLIKHNFTFNEAMQEAIWMVRTGEDQKFLAGLDKRTLGNKYLSTEVDENGNFKQGTATDNQDLAIKQAIRQNFKLIHEILETQGAALSDESLLSTISKDELKGLKAQILSGAQGMAASKGMTGAAGKLLQRYNSLLAEIVSLSQSEESKTDTQRLKEEKEGESEAEKVRKQDLAEKKQELQDILQGRGLGRYFEDAMFELSLGINNAFAHDIVTMRGYLEYKTGRKFEDIPEGERDALIREYTEYAKGQRADDISMRARMYHQAALLASEALKNGESFYNNLVYSADAKGTVGLLNNRNNVFKQALLLFNIDPQKFVDYIDTNIANLYSSAIEATFSLADDGIVLTPSHPALGQFNNAKALPEDTEDQRQYKNEELQKAAMRVLLDSMSEVMRPYTDGTLDYINPEVREVISQMLDLYDKMYKNYRFEVLEERLKQAALTGELRDLHGNTLLSGVSADKLLNFTGRVTISGSDVAFEASSHVELAKQAEDPFAHFYEAMTGFSIQESLDENGKLQRTGGRVLIADDVESGFDLATLLNTAVETLMRQLVEDEDVGVSPEGTRVSNWRQILDNTPHTPVIDLLSKYMVSTGKISQQAMQIYQSALDKIKNFQTDISQILLTQEEAEALRDAINVARLFQTAIFGARTDKGDFTNLWGGYNAAVNAFHKGEDEYEALAEIESEAADYMSLDMEMAVARMESVLGLHEANSGSKLNNQSKVGVNYYKLIHAKMKAKLHDVALPDDWMVPSKKDSTIPTFQALKDAIDRATLLSSLEAGNIPVLNEEQLVQAEKEMLDLQDAWFEFYQSVKDKDMTILLEKFSLDENMLAVNENSKVMSDTSFLWWLASRAAVQATDFFTKYRATITTDLAPLSLQEMSAYSGYAFFANRQPFTKFMEAANAFQKKQWDGKDFAEFLKRAKNDDEKNLLTKLFKDNGYKIASNLPVWNNLLLIEGIAGSGKTKAVLSSIIKIIKAENPDVLDKAWVVAPRSLSGAKTTLADNIGLDKAKQLTHKSLLQSIIVDPKEHGTELEYGVDCERDLEGSVRAKIDLKAFMIDDVPSMIIIDEAGMYNYLDLDAINQFAAQHGIPVVTLGDLQQETPIGEVTLEKNLTDPIKITLKPAVHSFMHTPKLGVSMRTDNVYIGEAVQYIQSKIDKGDVAKLEFRYTETDKGLFGVQVMDVRIGGDNLAYTEEQKKQVYEKLMNLKKTLKEGEKIGFIYSSPSSTLYQALTDPTSPYYNADLISVLETYQGSAQGFENQYFLVELAGFDKNDEEFLASLYTGISRAKQGAIVITPTDRASDSSIKDGVKATKVKKLSSSFSSIPPEMDSYTTQGIEKYAEKRMRILDVALRDREIVSVPTSSPTGPTTSGTPAGPATGGTSPSGSSGSSPAAPSTSGTSASSTGGSTPPTGGSTPSGGASSPATPAGGTSTTPAGTSSPAAPVSPPIDIKQEFENRGIQRYSQLKINGVIYTIDSPLDESDIKLRDESGSIKLYEAAELLNLLENGLAEVYETPPELETGNEEEGIIQEDPDFELKNDEGRNEELIENSSLPEAKTEPENEAEDAPVTVGYSFNTFSLGRRVSPDGKSWLDSGSPQRDVARRDGVNGLEALKRAGFIPRLDTNNVEAVRELLRRVQLILLSSKSNHEKEIALKNEFLKYIPRRGKTLLPVIRVDFISSANTSSGKWRIPETSLRGNPTGAGFLAYDHLEDEQLEFNLSADYEEESELELQQKLQVPIKRISAMLYYELDGQLELGLEVPLVTLQNPLTVIQTDSRYAKMNRRLQQLRGNTSIHNIIHTLLTEFAGIKEYEGILKALRLFNYTQTQCISLTEDDGSPLDFGSLMYAGVQYARERGRFDIKAKRKLKGGFKSIAELQKAGLHTSKVLVSTQDLEKTTANGTKVTKKGHPYVLVSYTDEKPTLDKYLDPNNKEIDLIEVSAGKISIDDYIENIIRIIEKRSNRRDDYGDKFTAVKLWKELLPNNASQQVLIRNLHGHVSQALLSKISSILAEFYAPSSTTQHKLDILSRSEDWRSQGIINAPLGNRTVLEQLTHALYRLVKPQWVNSKLGDPAYEADAKDYLSKRLGGVPIYRRIKKKFGVGREVETNLSLNEAMIYGKLDPPEFLIPNRVMEQIYKGTIGTSRKVQYPHTIGLTSSTSNVDALGQHLESISNSHREVRIPPEIRDLIEANTDTSLTYDQKFTQAWNSQDYGSKTGTVNGHRFFIEDVSSVSVDGTTVTISKDGKIYNGEYVNKDEIRFTEEGAGQNPVEQLTFEVLGSELPDELRENFGSVFDDTPVPVSIIDGGILINGEELSPSEYEEGTHMRNFIDEMINRTQKQQKDSCAPISIKLK